MRTVAAVGLVILFGSARLACAQTTLNMSEDLVGLGIASTNMVPNQPTLDAGPLLKLAVAYAQSHNISTVIADPGAYYFLTVNSNNHVLLSLVNNLTIDFQGSDLIFTHPLYYGIVIYYGANATLENFTADYQPLPFTQVSVVGVDVANAQIQYAVQPGWPDPATFNSLQGPTGPPTAGVYIFRNGQPAFGVRRSLTQLPITGGHFPLMFFTAPATPAPIRPGDVAVLALSNGLNAVVTTHCSGCTLRNITVFSASGTGVQMAQTQASVMERIYSIPKPGTDRLVGSFGVASPDPIAGPNNQIRLSRAIRGMDDGFALYTRYVGTVQSQSSSQSLTVAAGFDSTVLGDGDSVPNGTPVSFQRLSDGLVLGSAIIISQSAVTGSPPQVTFAFDRGLPGNLIGTIMYSTDANQNGANSVLERSTVQSQASGRGADLEGLANSTVRGNYFRRTAYAAISLSQSMVPGEVPTPPFVNLNISNNVIDGANMNSDWWWLELGAIQTATLTNPGYALMAQSVFSNINLTNNFIADSGRSAVWMGNTSGGSVTGNYILNANARPDLANDLPQYQADALLPLVIDSTSSGIATSSNTIDSTSGRVFVTDTQYRELAAYPPGGTIRLNAYNLGTLANPAVTLTDADGVTTPVTVQNTTSHALDVQLPAGAGLGGAYITLASGSVKYFGTLFIDSQDNIPTVNGCTYEASLSSTSVPSSASALPILVVTQAGCSYQVLDTDSFVNPGTGSTGTAVIPVGFTANTGAGRSTTIEIAGQPFTLTQAAPPPGLSISKSHSGNFTQGQQNATYTITVSNAANAGPTSGSVTVAETAPSGLTLVSMAGTGWTCTTLPTCTTGTVLAGGQSYSPIAVKVNVNANATSPQVNQASVSGGGSATASATDSTVVNSMTTVSTSPAGLAITVDNAPFTAPQTFSWTPGSQHVMGVSTPQAGPSGSGTQYAFTSWSDSGAASHTITVGSSAATYTATFATQYLLTTTASPASGGSVNANPSSASGYYNAGTGVQLTATAGTGFQFSNWSGALSGQRAAREGRRDAVIRAREPRAGRRCQWSPARPAWADRRSWPTSRGWPGFHIRPYRGSSTVTRTFARSRGTGCSPPSASSPTGRTPQLARWSPGEPTRWA